MYKNLTPDSTLVTNYIQGCEASLELLIKKHKQRLYSFIYSKVQDREITEDVFQDTFIKVIRTLKLGNYNEEGKFVANEDHIYAFAESDDSLREKPLPQFIENPEKIRYRVRSGDYLGKIAERYGVGVSQIKKWNGLKNNKLKVGQRLTIYPTKPIDSSNKTSITKTTTKGNVKLYTVKNGDSLWSISQKYPGVTVQNIKIWNGISSNKLQPGMKLKIYKG